MRVLVVSNNREYIKKAKEVYEDADVAFSVESAEILMKKNKYGFIMSDILKDSFNGLEVRELEQKKKTDFKLLRQEVVAVYSFRGGVGKTSLVKMVSELIPAQYKVLILDFNFADGGSDLSFIFQLPQIPHMGMYLKNQTKEGLLENCIKVRDNVYILQSPPKKNLVKDLGYSETVKLINTARTAFDVILIDLSNDFNETVRGALDCVTKIIVVSKGAEPEYARMREFNYEFLTFFVKPVRDFRKYAKLLNLKYEVVRSIEKEADKICNFIFIRE